MGYIPNAELEAEVEKLLKTRSGQAIKSQKNREITELEEKEHRSWRTDRLQETALTENILL